MDAGAILQQQSNTNKLEHCPVNATEAAGVNQTQGMNQGYQTKGKDPVSQLRHEARSYWG